jgi:nucleoside-diphosphate-sugar epimerase/predicted dehydrogenase
MKVGLIGSGQIAKVHGRQLLQQPYSSIVGIADMDVARARLLANELGVNAYYQDASTMIVEQKPDIVHITTPPQSHAPMSILAMKHGCHVLVEKPMALTIDDAQEMIVTAQQNNVQLCVNHNMVFENVFQQALHLARTGTIGNIISIETRFLYNAKRNPALLREGAEYSHWAYRLNGGILQDLLPHPASLLMEFIPDITTVQSIGKNHGLLPETWQDDISILVQSTTASGYIRVSLTEWPDTVDLIIRGKEGTITSDLFTNVLTYQRKCDLPRAVIRGFSGFQLSFQYLRTSLGNTYKAFLGRIDKSNGIGHVIQKFHEFIRNGGEPPTSLDKSLRVVELISKVWPVPRVDNKNVETALYTVIRHSKPTVLVTGASGFIGTHLLTKLLSEKLRVLALVRPNSMNAGRLRKFDVEIVQGDLSDHNALIQATKEIKTIYHVGAAMTGNWEENYQTTIKGTEYLVEAALSQGVERFIHVSTVAVYDLLGLERNASIKEDTPYLKNPRGIGPYANAKIEAEKIVLEASERKGLPATVLRLGMVIGPSGRVFFPHFGYRYSDKVFFVIGKGNMILPLTYVENTVDGIYEAALEVKAIGQTYNVVDDAKISVRDYLKNFIDVTGIQARIIRLPYLIPYMVSASYELGAALNILKKGMTSRTQLKWKQAQVVIDNSKIKKDLGWAPKISMEEGLRRTFEWYSIQRG